MIIHPRKLASGSRLGRSVLAVPVLACVLFAPIAVAEEPGGSLTPELIWTRTSISDLQLSPDGGRLAMIVSEPALGSETRRNVWIYDFSTRRLRRFTSSVKPDSRPRFSPDGGTLAFISTRGGSDQIYGIDLDGGEAHPLTEAKTRVRSFEWAPDGKRIALETAAPKTDEEEKKEKDKDDARIAGSEEKSPLLQVMDIASKTVRTLAQGPWRISEYVWMPDGSALVISATDDPQRELFSNKIYRLAAGDGKMDASRKSPRPLREPQGLSGRNDPGLSRFPDGWAPSPRPMGPAARLRPGSKPDGGVHRPAHRFIRLGGWRTPLPSGRDRLRDRLL